MWSQRKASGVISIRIVGTKAPFKGLLGRSGADYRDNMGWPSVYERSHWLEDHSTDRFSIVPPLHHSTISLTLLHSTTVMIPLLCYALHHSRSPASLPPGLDDGHAFLSRDGNAGDRGRWEGEAGTVLSAGATLYRA